MKVAQLNFTAGELTPRLAGRMDYTRYQAGASLIRNFVVSKYGGVSNRPGTWYLGEAPGLGRLIPFQFNKADTYVLEFTEYLMRVIRNDAYVTGADIATPYPASALRQLHYTQSADVMFLTHPDFAPRKLSRTSHTAWTLAVHDLVPDMVSPSDVVAEYSGSGTDRRILYKVSVIAAAGRESDPGAEVVVDTSWPWGSAERVDLRWSGYPGTGQSWAPSSARRTNVRTTGYSWVAGYFTSIRSASYQWIAGTGPAGTYYCQTAAGGDPGLSGVNFVAINGAEATKVTFPGELGIGQWAVGDTDSLQYDTVYVRLAADPDTLAEGYIGVRTDAAQTAYKLVPPVAISEPTVVKIAGVLATKVADKDEAAANTWWYDSGSLYVQLSADPAANPQDQADGYVETATGLEYYLSPAPSVVPPYLYEDGAAMASGGAPGALASRSWGWGDNDSLGGNTIYVRMGDDDVPALRVTYRLATVFKWVVYKNQSGTWGWIGDTESGVFIDDDIAPDYTVGPEAFRDPFTGTNFPESVALHQQRLWYAGTDDYPQSVYGSQLSDFDNFGVSFPMRQSDAIEVSISSRCVNTVRHLVPAEELVLFTDGGEWIVTHNATTDFLSPLSIRFVSVGSTGCHSILQPLLVSAGILFAQRDGRAIRELRSQGQGVEQVDRSQDAEHLFRDDPVVEWAWQQHPEGVVWAVREDGVLLGLTYQPEHNVFAWHQHDTDGEFVSVCSLPGDGEDLIYFLVLRNGRYYLEKLSSADEDLRLDCAKAAATGLTHLAGETVGAQVDGRGYLGLTCSGAGVVTLPLTPTSTVYVGLSYTSQLQTLPTEIHDGSTLGLPHKIRKVALRVDNSREVKVGPSFDSLVDVPWRTSEAWNEVTARFTGMKEVFIPQCWRRDGSMCFEVSLPLPVSILSVCADLAVGGE